MAESAVLINRPNSSSSPPPNCAICLGTFANKCFSDSCMHQFCFKCLLEWSKIKAECPLCKKAFKRIIHNVKSNDEYDEHIVEIEPSNELFIDNNELVLLPWVHEPQPPTRHHFHFRTTFTVDTRGEHAIQQMLLSHPLTNGSHISVGPYPLVRNMYHRRRRENTSTSFRRSIYTRNLWVNSPPDLTGHYRDISPGFYRENPGARTRLVPWLNRELNALLYENTQLVMHVVDVIMDHLMRYHICSRAFRSMLFEYLENKTDHFVHEFYSFMRSPFDMIGYDRHVIYTERPSSPDYVVMLPDDDPSDDSDVILVGASNPQQPVVIDLVDDSDSDEPILVSHNVPMPAPVPHLPSTSTAAILDSSSSDGEVQETKSNVKKERTDRKPLLPLKLRLKRKRQSRELKKNSLKRRRKERSRSRSSSTTSPTSRRRRSISSSSDTSRSSSEDLHKKYKKRRKPSKKSSNKRSHKHRRSSSDMHVDVVSYRCSSPSSSTYSSDSDTDNVPLSTFTKRNNIRCDVSIKSKCSKASSCTPPRSYTPPCHNSQSSDNTVVLTPTDLSSPGYSGYIPNNINSSNSQIGETNCMNTTDTSHSQRSTTTPPLPITSQSPATLMCTDTPSCSAYTYPSPSYVDRTNEGINNDCWRLKMKSDEESSDDNCKLNKLLDKMKKKIENKERQWDEINEGPSTSRSNRNNCEPRLKNLMLKKEEASNMWYSYPHNDSESSEF